MLKIADGNEKNNHRLVENLSFLISRDNLSLSPPLRFSHEKFYRESGII